jgi:hypothetical protein
VSADRRARRRCGAPAFGAWGIVPSLVSPSAAVKSVAALAGTSPSLALTAIICEWLGSWYEGVCHHTQHLTG